jgi:hypothetical protein
VEDPLGDLEHRPAAYPLIGRHRCAVRDV